MLTQRQIEYEIDYWRNSTRQQNDARQKRILELWEFRGAPSVLEIGPGPYGGCLPFVSAEDKTGIDPLYRDYRMAGFDPPSCGPLLSWSIRDLYIRASEELKFDAILCMNVLDHGDKTFGDELVSIPWLLKPGGRFYLHLNLRTPEQLNEGHDHALSLDDFYAAFAMTELKQVWVKVYDRDPVEDSPYRTVVGCWERSNG